ncbi:CotS family spore coat protein [uncultured Clostridium sp.]|uniref:CotS family spore coat protein n=1 Tax=uncultured Clostridium sp. TaxID=59620 RepID=UPI0028E5DFFF|nr:CotS family spore coat protein [uncultured Clostridium sp.]
MPIAAGKYNINILAEENIKKYILPYYGLENFSVTQIKFKDTDKQRAVYKIYLKDESYCLKKVYFPLDQLLFVYSSIEWFYRYGINVPKILPTLDRNRYVEFNSMLFILTPWIQGEKCDYDKEEHVLVSAKNLALMHLCGKNFSPIKGSYVRYGKDDIHRSIQKRFHQLLNCSNLAFNYKDNFSKIFLQNFDTNILMAQASLNVGSTIDSSNLSTSLCHLDYVNKNIIFDTESNIWVIDFDKCKIDYCVHDIGYFMRRFLRRDKTNWNVQLALNCIHAYESVKPLTLDEYKYLLVYVGFPQKYWKISRDYYKNINKCNKKSFIKILNKAIENNDKQLEFVMGFSKYIEERFNVKL